MGKHFANRLTLVCALVAIGLLAAHPVAAQFDPPVAPDINPDPNIVEVNLSAAETSWQFLSGIPTTVYAYNGSIPGPTIEAELGNTVIVHFTNNLPEATTIHWHGIDTPASMDGSHISQLWVQPGESFDYQFVVNRASLFWYHPHVRTFDQVEKGLYGALLVRDPVKDAALGLENLEEHIVIFDDVLLDAGFEIVPAFSFTDPLQNAEYQLNGREGNYLLVNGKWSDEVSLTVDNGKPQRWRIVNAANTTFARLGIEELGVDLHWIGTDSSLLEESRLRDPVVDFPLGPVSRGPGPPQPLHPTTALNLKTMEGVFLVPGERMDVIFTPLGSDGQTFTIWQHDWLRGRHVAVDDGMGGIMLIDDPMDGLNPNQPYMELVLSGPDPGTGEFAPPLDLQTTITTPGTFQGILPVTFGHAPPDPQGNVTLFAQADFSSGSMVPLPSAKIDAFNAHDVNVGEQWGWEVKNLTHGDHPFHTHGFPFVVLEFEFIDDLDPSQDIVQPMPFKMLKDTVRAPARGGAVVGSSRSITRLLTYFDDTGRENDVAAMGGEPTFHPDDSYTSGGWLFHCHVLEHAAKGMLSFYEVHDPNDPFTLLGKNTTGTNGYPYLTAEGDLAPGTAVTFNLVNALANARAILGASTVAERSEATFLNGEIVPALDTMIEGTTDGDGDATWNITEWDLAPSGTDFYVQVGVEDPGGFGGWALSNALTFTKP